MSKMISLVGPFPEAPAEGWQHALNLTPDPLFPCLPYLKKGDVFGWKERGQLWSGIISEVDHRHLRVFVTNILPAVME